MLETDKQFSCIILAGGEGRRVDGRDKGLINYNGKALIQHVIDIVKPQTDEIIISANRNIETYKTYGHSVISDTTEQYQGPLAGIAATLPSCKHEWVFIIPCDMPFLPSNGVKKLCGEIQGHSLCIAKLGDRLQLMFLVKKSLFPSIHHALQSGHLKLMDWAQSQNPTFALFNNARNFMNFNNSKIFNTKP